MSVSHTPTHTHRVKQDWCVELLYEERRVSAKPRQESAEGWASSLWVRFNVCVQAVFFSCVVLCFGHQALLIF